MQSLTSDWETCSLKFLITFSHTLRHFSLCCLSLCLHLRPFVCPVGVCELPACSAAFQSDSPVCLWHWGLQPSLCFHSHQGLPTGMTASTHFLNCVSWRLPVNEFILHQFPFTFYIHTHSEVVLVRYQCLYTDKDVWYKKNFYSWHQHTFPRVFVEWIKGIRLLIWSRPCTNICSDLVLADILTINLDQDWD